MARFTAVEAVSCAAGLFVLIACALGCLGVGAVFRLKIAVLSALLSLSRLPLAALVTVVSQLLLPLLAITAVLSISVAEATQVY